MSVYLIAEIEVKNAEAYAEYAAQTPGLVARHGGKFIVRGGPAEALEGEWSGRLVVMEFANQAGLESFWNDPCLLYTSDAADDLTPCRSRWSPYH